MACGRDLRAGRRPMEVLASRHRQVRSVDRLHAVRPTNTQAAYRFLRKAVKRMGDYPPASITTDKLVSYPKAIQQLQNEGRLPKEVVHRTSKHLNYTIEADHGALKCVIQPTRGFQGMQMACATIKGLDVMRMIRRGHCALTQPGATGEIRLINKLFGLAA